MRQPVTVAGDSHSAPSSPAADHRLTARLLEYLAEVERRDLHLKEGCSSLFAYCVERLGMAEGAAYKRV